MKTHFTIFLSFFLTFTVFSQSPDKMSYQAVIRDNGNKLLSNTAVGMRISILQYSATGSTVYVETQKPTTNFNGLAGIEIGSGTVVSGSFATIDWSKGPYFIKTETDPNGGTNYTITGTSQLLSVPYALYAKNAGNGFSGNYNDLTNKPTIPTKLSELINDKGFTGDYNNLINKPTIPTKVSELINDKGYTGDYKDLINKPTIPTKVSELTNDKGFISAEKDSSVTNEIQALSIKDDTLFLSKTTGFVKLPAVPKEKDSSVNNEIQALSIKDDTLFLSKTTGFVKLPKEKDSSVTNEIQSLSVRNDTIFLSKNGGFVVLPKNNIISNSATSNGSFYFHSVGSLSKANDSVIVKYSVGYNPVNDHFKTYSFLIPKDGIIKNLIATPTQNSVASGSNLTVNILLNGKPTSINVSFTNADGFIHKINTTNSISVKQGDFIAIQYKSKGSVSPGTFFQAIVELAPNAPKNEFAHYIGELYGGGIVVSVWKDTSGAEHGLVASLKDLSTGTAWSNVTTTAIGATAQSFIDGQANTKAIIAQSGHTSSAAQMCDTFTGGGHNDWYLPAHWEIAQINNVAYILNAILGSSNNFGIDRYWSSTESSANVSFIRGFSQQSSGGMVKNTTTNGVRAMRKY